MGYLPLCSKTISNPPVAERSIYIEVLGLPTFAPECIMIF